MSLFGRSDRDAEDRNAAGPEGSGSAPKTAQGEPRPARTAVGAAGGPGGKMANIGKSITIKGDLTGDEDLVIEGNVEGKVLLPNNQLTIGANGKVRADVEGKSVVVVGHVAGNVTATDRVEIQASGTVDGDVRAPKLIIQEGAVLNGGVEMTGKKASAPAPSPSPSLPKPSTAAEARPSSP
jgi:cytoskeletal protein CcmA (bactofilin family)